MNKKTISSLIFSASILGCFGAFAPNQVNAECMSHDTMHKCEQDTNCYWYMAVSQCVGSSDECYKVHDEQNCSLIKGCTWSTPPEGFGFCYDRMGLGKKDK
jgi:hypothetical protein